MARPKIKRTVATMTINGGGKLSRLERADLVQWLKDQIKLVKNDEITKGRYRAGLRYY